MRKFLTFIASGLAAVGVASSAEAAQCTTVVDPIYVFARDPFTYDPPSGTGFINLGAYTTPAPGIPAGVMNWTKIAGSGNLRIDATTDYLAPTSTNDADHYLHNVTPARADYVVGLETILTNNSPNNYIRVFGRATGTGATLRAYAVEVKGDGAFRVIKFHNGTGVERATATPASLNLAFAQCLELSVFNDPANGTAPTVRAFVNGQAIATFVDTDPIGTQGGPINDIGRIGIAMSSVSNANSTIADNLFARYFKNVAVRMNEHSAVETANGHELNWSTGYEYNNLGFNIYTERNGQRVKLNRDLIAGSALKTGSELVAGTSYSWTVRGGAANSVYFIESVDLSGATEMSGAIQVHGRRNGIVGRPNAKLITELASEGGNSGAPARRMKLSPGARGGNTLAADPNAYKLGVRNEGWYRVTPAMVPQLAAVPASQLALFSENAEVPAVVNRTGNSWTSIEFYGTGADEAFTDTRMYWLARRNGNQKSMNRVQGAAGSDISTFMDVVENRERVVYFSSLRNGAQENFFGSIVSNAAIERALTINDLASGDSTLSVELQAISNNDHSVRAFVNDRDLGLISYSGNGATNGKLVIPAGVLANGANRVKLVAEAAGDHSLVASIALHYPRNLRGETPARTLSVPAKSRITLSANSATARVLDVTQPLEPFEYATSVVAANGKFDLSFNTVASRRTSRQLLVVDGEAMTPSVVQNNASTLSQGAADLVIITHASLRSAVEPLRAKRQAEGLSVAVVDIDDVFDEYSYGNKDPEAIRAFLKNATEKWSTAPRYVVLAGKASYDPKNYLGAGDADLVPSKLLDSESMESPSDLWFADVDGNGTLDLSIGRMPARTAAEMTSMVTKVTGPNRPIDSMAVINDSPVDNVDANFVGYGDRLEQLGKNKSILTHRVDRSKLSAESTRAEVLATFALAPPVINYVGHGSVNLWASSILKNDDVATLNNEGRSSVVLAMTCLNGYFVSPTLDALGTKLLAANGGASAVWSSSTMAFTDRLMPYADSFMSAALRSGEARVGDAINESLGSAVVDADTRFLVLLGDPSMRLR